MSGSGTTIVCAREKGHIAVGCDTDPLALLIARAWCSDIDPEKVRIQAARVLNQAKKKAETLDLEEAYPNQADKETRRFIEYWFDDENRRQLTALSGCIMQTELINEKVFLWCAFSRLIITKSTGVSLAMDISHSRPHKVYQIAPIHPFDIYLREVEKVIKKCPFQMNDKSIKNRPLSEIRKGDARCLPINANSIDMIITSPPYLNAIDYLRGHKLSLVWMGYRISFIRHLRSENVGSEISKYPKKDKVIYEMMNSMGEIDKLDNRRMGMLCRYVYDMNDVLRECARVLKRNCQAIFVVGNSSIQGIFIKNSEAIIQLATNHGFSLVSKTFRPLAENRRYLPPPNLQQSGKQLQRRMREEVILKFVID
jgi:DNA modification methylase